MISIVIVVYNASKYLKLALESVLNQSYKNYEIIAVDDGSTDKTVNILMEYSHLDYFRFIRKEHSKNLGGNRNEAIKIAKGEFIAFIDGDDIWEHNKLSKQVEYIKKYDMICSNASLINENNELISNNYFNRYKNNSEIELHDLVADNFVRVSTVIIKKSAIEDAGYFEDGPDTRAEDYILWLNYLKKNKIYFINESLVKYRIHDKNWSNSKPEDWKRLLNRTIEIRRSFLNYPNEKVKKAAKIGCAVSYLELGKFEIKNKNYKSAESYLSNLVNLYEPKLSVKYIKYFVGYIYILFLSKLIRS